jgi:VWFA-related protein
MSPALRLVVLGAVLTFVGGSKTEPPYGPTGGSQPEPPYGQQQQPVFRSRTDLVTVDVSVRSQGTPIAGLTAKDFVLTDNGVPQTVEEISMEAVPVDVTVLVDMNQDLADDLKGMSQQIPRIIAMVRPDDRLRVTAINTYVTDLFPAQKAATAPTVGRLAPSGLSSAHDGLASALLRETDPNRRHLVVAITNGIDATSTLDAAAVRDIAKYSNATLYIAQVDIAQEPGPPGYPPTYTSGRQRSDRDKCMASGICSPTKWFWQPFGDYEFETLGEAATLTGGKLYLPGIFTDRNAAAIFKKVFEDYRQSYVLRYAPKGVPAQGWHEVKVTIPSQPSYEVHARRGYFVDAPGRTPSPKTSPETPDLRLSFATRVTIADLAQAYGQGNYEGFVSALRRVPNRGELIRDFRAAGNPWPDNPNRESAFVLELADAAFQSPRLEDRDAAKRLLAAHRPLVRGPFGPEAYEKYWLWAAIVVLEGANQGDLARTFIDDGLKTFPNEPRFLLARAFVTDQKRALDTLVSPKGDLSPAASAHVDVVGAMYDEAAAAPEASAEARLRKSWLLQRAGKRDQALAMLDGLGDLSQDTLLAHLRHLLRGRVLDSLGRNEEAVQAYREALALAPDAQSARVGLMAALQRMGDHAGARVVAEAIQNTVTDTIDPWWRYWQGDYRLFPTVITRLREQGK